jgi:hypothetical protein
VGSQVPGIAAKLQQCLLLNNHLPAARPGPFQASNIQQQNLNYNNRRTSNIFQQPPPQVQAPAQQRRHVSWNNRIDERIIDKRQATINIETFVLATLMGFKAKADPITIKRQLEPIGQSLSLPAIFQ